MNFFFPSRIARLSYFIRSLAFGVATRPLASLFDQKNTVATLNDLWLFLLAVALLGYWLACIVRPRCKDVGMRWGWIFLMLIPLVDVGFGLIRYGSDTPKLASAWLGDRV